LKAQRLFPAEFDEIYFGDASWQDRVRAWLQANSDAFTAANRDLIERLLANSDTGLRMVVNITADALLRFLASGRYLNLYDEPVIGGVPREPSDDRRRVDELLGLGEDTYFGAVALGGTGVRYYGEYSMVLRPEAIDPDTRLLDRDSYDLLMAPLAGLGPSPRQVERLRGTWASDVDAMVLLRVLPEIRQARQLVTSGTVSELVLRDQEFVEVHKQGSFGPANLEEIRESPDEAAIESMIQERQRRGGRCSVVEHEWVRRRMRVREALEGHGIRHRIVTLHGRGYQWA
jgi:hypothetical protein